MTTTCLDCFRPSAECVCEPVCDWCGDPLTSVRVETINGVFDSDSCADKCEQYHRRWIAKKVRREAEREG